MPVSMSNGSAGSEPASLVPAPEPCERPAGEGCIPPQPEQVDDRGRQVAQAHRLGDHPIRRHSLGIHDHQRHLDELPVQAAAVEEQEVIAQVLAVIRGDDHQRIVEHAAPAQLIEEEPQPPIEISNAIVINIGGHPHIVV